MRLLFGYEVLRVQGRSMAPTLAPGDFVLVRRYTTWRGPRGGDIVTYSNDDGQLLVKRLGKASGDGFRVSGDGPLSAPCVDLGNVPVAAMRGRVVQVIRSREKPLTGRMQT